MKQLSYLIRDFQKPPAPANRVICLLHATPVDLGGDPVVDFLQRKYMGLGGGNRTFVPSPRTLLRNATGRTFVVNVPFGWTVGRQADQFELPARYMTTPVLIIPVGTGLFDFDAMGLIRSAMRIDDPVAFALGDVTAFSPQDAGKERINDLSEPVRGLIAYLEACYERPVVYVATGPDGPVATLGD